MELESLFTGSKWDIMKELAKESRTPLELSSILSTSSPNISQQLRLLELAELIKKVRIKGTEKGRPETRYSLTKNFSYLICINNNMTDKKILEMSDFHSVILNVWFLQNQEMHYYLEKFFWLHEDIFKSSEFIGFMGQSEGDIELMVISKNPEEIIPKFDNISINNGQQMKRINAMFFTLNEAERFSENDAEFISLLKRTQVLHDPNNILAKLKKEKQNEQTE
jgi:predicted transcriptional regulator